MKQRIFSVTFLFLLCVLAIQALSLKEANKAMLQLFAYDAKGKLLRSGPAFFVDEQGNVVSSYALLVDAIRAEVMDIKGKKYSLHRILGANATTDLVKFSTEGVKGNAFFSLTTSPAAQGSALQIIQYTTRKKDIPQAISISSDEPYNSYRYYHITAKNDSALFGCPLIDAEGRLVAIVQRNVVKGANAACAIDARFISELSITATSALNNDLRSLHFPKALPANAKDAMTYFYMLPQKDSLVYQTACDDYITTWPNRVDGYVNRGNWYANKREYAACETDYRMALGKAPSDTTDLMPDAIHYNLSNLIYHAVVAQKNAAPVYPGWTMQRAEHEADQALAIRSHTLYLMQKANCQFASRNYEGAYQNYSKVCADPQFASSETFYSAACALDLARHDSVGVLTLLDSCIAHIPHPVSAKNAEYYFIRYQRLLGAGQARKAVLDLNEYEKAVGPKNLTANFYSLRSQAEMQGRMYQQALDDIRTAIASSATPLPFRLDEAYILLQVGEFEQAISAATQLLKDLPENSDCYKIMGIAQGELKQKEKAIQNLNKAKRLGDDSVEPFLQKYQ